ncbi:hypothetical protein DEO72_LG4g1271 [Vigna unguiculata]|uniref:Uncharacterized protein n=1 Tax=Vigna unguiculata TaxID=3917 RepID=A0A4D6LQB0_VIGUN|nr:hypothetical protein DEO72_LG4g1271 [Vigna unguiculata]
MLGNDRMLFWRETLAQARSRGNLDVLSATSRPGERFWGSERQGMAYPGKRISPKRDNVMMLLF